MVNDAKEQAAARFSTNLPPLDGAASTVLDLWPDASENAIGKARRGACVVGAERATRKVLAAMCDSTRPES